MKENKPVDWSVLNDTYSLSEGKAFICVQWYPGCESFYANIHEVIGDAGIPGGYRPSGMIRLLRDHSNGFDAVSANKMLRQWRKQRRSERVNQ
jgi:hypothetical protein